MLEPIEPPTRELPTERVPIDWPSGATIDQLCEWLDNRIRVGAGPSSEEVLAQFPQWQHDTDAALDLIYTEYSARCEIGSTPSHEEFYNRFPQWRQELEHQFQLANLFDNSATANVEAEITNSPRDVSSAPRYRVVKLLARGGIGQVMQAIDTELNREVAVKEIQTQLAENIAVRERFIREAEITGQLEHPGIVPIYGLGSDENDRPFYAMRLVRGQSLLDAIQDFHQSAGAHAYRSLRFQNLLRRFLSVCETISYAHSRGVIHRDIKPENILLGPFGETLVVDWGLAKVAQSAAPQEQSRIEVSASLHGQSSDAYVDYRRENIGIAAGQSPANWSVELTQSAGVLVGTPAYMSPEQARGDNSSITMLSDVYSLGATLHMLLTGVPRFPASDLSSALHAILNDDLATPRMLNRRVPCGLDAICTKALQLNPSDRYAAAADVARDIEHYLADEPVTALHESAFAHVMRLTRRHRSLAFSSVVSMMILTAVAFVAVVQINRERQLADVAFIAAERGNARLAFDRGYQLLETHQFGEGLLWLQRALVHVPAGDRSMRRVILTNMAAARGHLLVRHAVFDNQENVALFEFDGEGRYLMTVGRTGRIRYWNADNGTILVEHQLPASRILAANIDAQGMARIVTANGRILTLYAFNESQSPMKVWEAKQPSPIHQVTLSSDGLCAVMCNNSENIWTVTVLNTLDGQFMASIPATAEAQIIVDDMHSRLVLIDNRQAAQFWKWQADQQEFQVVGTIENVHRLTLSPDGKWVLVGTPEGGVSCYSALTLKLENVIGHFLGKVVALVVSPDSEVLVAVWDNGISRSWNLRDLQPACESLRVDRYTMRVLFRPGTRQLALLAKPHIVALWQLPQSNHTSLPLPVRYLHSIEYSLDGRLAMAASRHRFAQFMDGVTGRIIGEPMHHTDFIKTACMHPNGQLALTASYDGSAILWNTNTGTRAAIQLSAPEAVKLNAAAFSPDGRWIATLDDVGSVKLWDAATGVLQRRMLTKNSSALEVCFDSSSQRLLIGHNAPDCGVRMWDVQTGQLLWTGKHTAAVRSVAISPDGRVAVSAGNDSTARLWDTVSGTALAELPSRGEIFVARFHPSGSMVATGGYDATIRLWKVPTGELVGEPMMHQALVTDFVFSSDGMRLLSGAVDATARLWDVDTCLPLSPPLPHDGEILAVALHPTADIALTGRLWQLPGTLPDEPELVERWTRLATQRAFTSGNNIHWLSPDEVFEEGVKFEAKAGCSWRDWPKANDPAASALIE